MKVREKIKTQDKLPDILSPQMVADYVGIDRQRVYDFCKCGDIESFHIGKSLKIRKPDMLKWLETLWGGSGNEQSS